MNIIFFFCEGTTRFDPHCGIPIHFESRGAQASAGDWNPIASICAPSPYPPLHRKMPKDARGFLHPISASRRRLERNQIMQRTRGYSSALPETLPGKSGIGQHSDTASLKSCLFNYHLVKSIHFYKIAKTRGSAFILGGTCPSLPKGEIRSAQPSLRLSCDTAGIYEQEPSNE